MNMKTKVFLIGFFMQSAVAFGQPYQSIFSGDTTKWNVYECAMGGGGTLTYYAFSDTVINEKPYYKMYRQRISYEGQPYDDYTDLYGFVREDTVLGKYWFLPHDEDVQQEVLFMDLSLAQGDTMFVHWTLNNMSVDSIVVDTVYYEENKKLVVLDNDTLNNCYESNIMFIEGVGATYGFYLDENDFNTYTLEPYNSYTLLCAYQDGEMNYQFLDKCYYPGGGSVSENDFSDQVKISPIPAQGRFEISMEQQHSKNVEYHIYNTLVELVLQGKIDKGKRSIALNKTGLFYLVITDDNRKASKKLVNMGY